MEFIMIILIVLATSKVTLQGVCSKKYITNFSDSICFNGIIYFFASLVFVFALKCSPQVIPFAFTFGVLTVLFQLFYIQAMSCGTLILTTISGVFLFKDKLTRKQIASIVVGIVGIVLINL